MVTAPVSDLEAFYALSVALTGFSEYDLRGTGLGETYLRALDDVVGTSVRQELLHAFARVRRDYAGGDRDRGMRIEILRHPKLGPVARNLILLWYFGSWYELPAAWREAYGMSPNDLTHVVSPESYQEGLVWKAAETHPMGAKAPGFATWAQPPGGREQ